MCQSVKGSAVTPRSGNGLRIKPGKMGGSRRLTERKQEGEL